MTAPHAAAVFAATRWRRPAQRWLPSAVAVPIAISNPLRVRPNSGSAGGPAEIEQLADDLRGAGEAARKITILGTAATPASL